MRQLISCVNVIISSSSSSSVLNMLEVVPVEFAAAGVLAILAVAFKPQQVIAATECCAHQLLSVCVFNLCKGQEGAESVVTNRLLFCGTL